MGFAFQTIPGLYENQYSEYNFGFLLSVLEMADVVFSQTYVDEHKEIH